MSDEKSPEFIAHGNPCNYKLTEPVICIFTIITHLIMFIAFASTFTRAGYRAKHLKSFNVDIIMILLKVRKLSLRDIKEPWTAKNW